MSHDKLNKRVKFLRQEKNKSRRMSSLDESHDVWIEENYDASPTLHKTEGLQIL